MIYKELSKTEIVHYEELIRGFQKTISRKNRNPEFMNSDNPEMIVASAISNVIASILLEHHPCCDRNEFYGYFMEFIEDQFKNMRYIKLMEACSVV